MCIKGSLTLVEGLVEISSTLLKLYPVVDGSVEGTQRVEVECLERRPHVEDLVSSKPVVSK